jgi:hypothetical protein
VPLSNHDNVKELTELIDSAGKNSVEEIYIKNAEVFQKQMSENIQAREILQMFLDYPVREYPEVEVVDPKKKK